MANKIDSGLDCHRQTVERGVGSRRKAERGGGVGERHYEPDLWRRAGGMAGRRREGSGSDEQWSEVGELANGVANWIYGEERAERQQWAQRWGAGSGFILSGARMENLGKSFCRTHLYNCSFYTAGQNRRTAVLHQTSQSVPPWTANKQMEANTQPEP